MGIQIRNLNKKYNSFGNDIFALRDVTLDISDGSFVAVVGQSGSGKTTLLNSLSGMDKPDSGQIIIDGVEITALSKDGTAKLRRRKIGVIYQFYNLIPELSIRDNILLPVELDGGEIDEGRLREILDTVGLLGREYDYPSALSGGQQQRVAIARALYQSPALILADEPTGNLDEKSGSEIVEMLRKLNEERGITVVVVTHSSAVAHMADRIISLKDGAVVSDTVNI